jgi:pimeloyl-ACP methyl ester carboxylesterase
LLLIHGLDSSRDIWRLVAPRIAERINVGVTSIDLPGFGDSPTDGKVSFRRMSALIRASTAQLGPVAVVGHSMGAALALHAARRSEGIRGAAIIGCPLPIARFNRHLFRALSLKRKFGFVLAPSPIE